MDMDNWILLHFTDNGVTQELFVNFELKLEMYVSQNKTMLVPITAREYDETPQEIIRLANGFKEAVKSLIEDIEESKIVHGFRIPVPSLTEVKKFLK